MREKKQKFYKYCHKKEKWVTPGILNSIKTRDQKYWQLKTLHQDHPHYIYLKQELKMFNNILRSVIRKAKKIYLDNYFEINKCNLRNTWDKVLQLIGTNNNTNMLPEYINTGNGIAKGDVDMAKTFNKYFTSIATNLAKSFDNSSASPVRTYMTTPPSSTFNFRKVTPAEVLEVLNVLKNKSSCGFDNISTNLLKRIFSPLVQPLTLIINQCITSGKFPSLLKQAKVLPLFKKNDRHDISNYRPISLLPAISKIFEKIIHRQIIDYFDTNPLLYQGQYGYRAEHSCELAALELMDRITQSLVTGKDPFCVFLDLSKAFDTLDHTILLEKLEFYGFNDISIKLCQSYLMDRTQYVVVNSSISECRKINIGVPQGSVLGPLLFCIYINDLPKASKIFTPIMFADDTTLLANVQDFPNLSHSPHIINEELDKIWNWLTLNKLSLNISKTKIMKFRIPPKKEIKFILTVKDKDIEQVSSFNFLGIVIEENLKWNAHQTMIANKIAKGVGVISRLKRFLNINILTNLYHTLVMSHVNYGLLVWGFGNNDRIYKLQKKAVRNISLSKYNAHSEPIFKRLNLINLPDNVRLRVVLFYYKLYYGIVPLYFHDYIPQTPNMVHSYNTRFNQLPIPVLATRNYRDNILRVRLVEIVSDYYNDIAGEISHSLVTYKYNIKSSMISCYSYWCNIARCYICSNT